MKRFLMMVLLVAACAAPAPAQERMTLIRGARVFDGERTLERADVLVRGGVIVEVGGSIAVPAGARVVDGAGHTLVPGLIDAHTHAFGDALREAVVFGVTTELDMFTDAAAAAGWKAEQGAGGAVDRADIRSAGTLVTAPGGHGTQFGMPIPTLTAADSADAFVAARIAEGSDWIKVVYDDGATYGLSWPTLDRSMLEAVIAAAHRRDRLAVVHVGTARAAREAIEAGADGLVHLFTDTLPDASFARLAAERGAFVIPTLVVLKSVTGEGGSAALVEDERLQAYLSPTHRLQMVQSFPAGGDAAARFRVPQETVRMLRAAGVSILAGTDAPNPGTAHGASMHRELELLVEAGLTAEEALASATSVPARAFGLADRGRIAAGMRADLLLVEGDPTRDITATRAIRGVWKAGVPVDRESYAQQVAAALAAQADAPRRLADGMISDFESGRADARFGTDWMASTDAMMGGGSTVEFTVFDSGADGSGKALRITGTTSDRTAPNVWSGVMWSPGSQPMQPVDLSSRRGVTFSARGDGRTYALMVFSQSAGMMPLSRTFTAGAEWAEHAVAWSDFGIDGRDVMAIVFVAALPAGAFRLEVDDVRLH